MTALENFERFHAGEFAPVPCTNENDYFSLWLQREIGTLEPVSQAIVGALLADRLSWVFAAGYQATLRAAFTDLPDGGWAAFTAQEAKDDGDNYPPTRLETGADGYQLTGCKSWVGHSRLVGHLIVTVNDPAGDKTKTRAVIIDAKRAGVSLTHRQQPKFLGAMSQGFAHFQEVEVAPHELIDFEPIRAFGRTEAKFVMLAATTYMFARARPESSLSDSLQSIAGALLALLAENETSKQVYGAIDRAFQSATDTFEQTIDTTSFPDYQSDRQLMRMYTARIQRRVGYAKNALQT
jgi:hypothetical protein